MISGGLCQATCGRCGGGAAPASAPLPAAKAPAEKPQQTSAALASADQVYPCDGGITISSIISMDGEQLGTLQEALRWAGLQGRLNNPALNVTFFAPTDDVRACVPWHYE